MGFTQLFTGVLTIIGTLLFMLWVNVRISLVVVLITPVSLLVASFIAKRTYDMFREQSQIRGEQTALVDEIISGQKVVKAFSQENMVSEKFDQVNQRLAKCSVKAIFFSSITNPGHPFRQRLVYAGVGIVGAFTALSGGISVGMLSCFLSYANQYTKPFNEISGVATELQNALACAWRESLNCWTSRSRLPTAARPWSRPEARWISRTCASAIGRSKSSSSTSA